MELRNRDLLLEFTVVPFPTQLWFRWNFIKILWILILRGLLVKFVANFSTDKGGFGLHSHRGFLWLSRKVCGEEVLSLGALFLSTLPIWWDLDTLAVLFVTSILSRNRSCFLFFLFTKFLNGYTHRALVTGLIFGVLSFRLFAEWLITLHYLIIII